MMRAAVSSETSGGMSKSAHNTAPCMPIALQISQTVVIHRGGRLELWRSNVAVAVGCSGLHLGGLRLLGRLWGLDVKISETRIKVLHQGAEPLAQHAEGISLA